MHYFVIRDYMCMCICVYMQKDTFNVRGGGVYVYMYKYMCVYIYIYTGAGSIYFSASGMLCSALLVLGCNLGWLCSGFSAFRV